MHEIKEVKQCGYPNDFQKSRAVEESAINKPDCVISINGQPFINLEFKRLADGKIGRYSQRVEDVLTKGEYLGTKYAVLTRFNETIIYAVENGKEIAKFDNPR